MHPATVSRASGADTLLLSPYAIDRLLRLRSMLEQQRAAEQMLHGSALADARALLPRAIFSLLLDCIDAGVGEDARRLLAGQPSVAPVAADASDAIARPEGRALTSASPA